MVQASLAHLAKFVVALHATNRLQRVLQHISRSVRRMEGQWKDSAPLGEEKLEVMPDVDFDTP